MAKKKRGRPSSIDRPVRVVETDEIYANYRMAAKDLGCNRGDVYLCLMHYRSKHNGYTFEFADEIDEEIAAD